MDPKPKESDLVPENEIPEEVEVVEEEDPVLTPEKLALRGKGFGLGCMSDELYN